MLLSFNQNTSQSLSKHLLQVEKLDRLRVCPGSASASVLGECVFSEELWGRALNMWWTAALWRH